MSYINELMEIADDLEEKIEEHVAKTIIAKTQYQATNTFPPISLAVEAITLRVQVSALYKLLKDFAKEEIDRRIYAKRAEATDKEIEGFERALRELLLTNKLTSRLDKALESAIEKAAPS